MRKLLAPALICFCFLLSGCTVLQYAYIRNLTEGTVDVYFDLNAAALKSIPDSIYIPYSGMSHQINDKTSSFMTDSIVAKRYSGTSILLRIPTGGMVMFDKTTAAKIGNYGPEKIKVKPSGKDPYTVKLVGPLEEGEKMFQTKGNSPKIYWYDIY